MAVTAICLSDEKGTEEQAVVVGFGLGSDVAAIPGGAAVAEVQETFTMRERESRMSVWIIRVVVARRWSPC